MAMFNVLDIGLPAAAQPLSWGSLPKQATTLYDLSLRHNMGQSQAAVHKKRYLSAIWSSAKE